MASNDVYETNLSRGKTGIRNTGVDSSSYGDTSTKGIKNKSMSGGPRDISSSIVDGKVRMYAGKKTSTTLE